ncbi:MAG: hypothetical protein HY906_00415 [Deltaproteobacteria bacterium]|nr:hypothetical protein [Deltaproteobacteria bacterium]
MSQRLEEFLRELPAKGVPENAVQLYRSVLEDFETFLGKAAQLRFSRYEVNRFVTQRQRAGASERELRNINTACAAYLSYCEAQAPAPAVGTAGEPDEGPTALAEAPPPQERRKVLLIVLGCVVLVVCLIGGCVVDKVRQSRAERAFSDELRTLGESCTGDRQLLREQILAAAKRYGVRFTSGGGLALGVSPLEPGNMNKLPMDQRLRAVAALQAQMRPVQAPPGMDGAPVRPRVVDEPLWYVEIQVVGEVKGVFGSSKLDLELHVLGGASPRRPPPSP